MQLEHVKTVMVGGWVLGLGATAVSFGVGSATGWMLLAGLGLIPPVMLFRMWHQPAATMPERIHEVLKSSRASTGFCSGGREPTHGTD